MTTVLSSTSSSTPVTVNLVEKLRPVAQEYCEAQQAAFSFELEACLCQVATEFQGSRVQSFVPLLALRRVKACMRANGCDTAEF